MQGQYNMRSPAVKRLMKEAQELRQPTELYHAQPLDDNLFEWHFTLRGPEESDFDGGFYHGRIILPPEYPMKPPSIILLTPNGRFETFKKICLSISGHHPESWQPSWSIRTALLAIIGFMPTHGGGAIGSLDYTTEERKVLAKKSQDWKCPECGDVSQKLKPKTEASEKAAQEAKELASQIDFQGEKQGGAQAKTTEESTSTTTTTAAATTPSAQATPTMNPNAALPQPPPFSYPWPMPPGWGHPGLASSVNLGSMTVPRFPYPPPMMMPPHSMFSTPPPSQTGEGGPRLPTFPPVPPFQLGLRFPAMPVAAEGTGGSSGVAPPQTGGDGAPSVSPASQPASAPTEATSSPTPAPAVTPTSTTATTAATSKASPPASLQTTAAAAAAATSPTSSATTTTGTAVTAAAASSASMPVSESATTTTTSSTAASSSSSSGPNAAPATELRQRSSTAQPQTVGGQQQPVSSAPPVQQTQWGYSPSTVVMMVLLSLAITLLLGRRMYMQFITKDFWGSFQ